MTARNDVEWRPLVAFEDQSSSYVHGFEAGMIWQRMQDSEAEIDAVTHTENRQTLMKMANAAGYALDLAPSGVDGWDNMKATQRPKRGPLSIVT